MSVEAGHVIQIGPDFDESQDLPTRLDANDGVIRVISPQALTGGSPDLPASPEVSDSPRTTPGEVTDISLTLRIRLVPSVPQGEGFDSDSSEELPRTKKWLSGDFALKTNTISLELPTLGLEVDRSRFRMFYQKICGDMFDLYIHIPLDHFLAGLNIPLDPVFCDFFNLVRCQPSHIHPNGVRYFLALTISCRRIGVEVSELILRTFFIILRMNNLALSLRPRPSVVTLFEPPPNKLGQWREWWVCVESK